MDEELLIAMKQADAATQQSIRLRQAFLEGSDDEWAAATSRPRDKSDATGISQERGDAGGPSADSK